MSTEAVTETIVTKPPKHIKVNGKHIRLRLVQNVAWSAAAAAVGGYMVSALYYLITQVHWHLAIDHTQLFDVWLKPGWDGLLHYSWWPYARHDIRDVYEGVFATLFVKSIITKHKHWIKKPVGAFRLATAPFAVFLAAAPVVAAGIWLVDIHDFTVPSSVTTYQAYLIGFVAAQVVHRVYAPIGNTVQEFFVGEAVAANRRPRWPLPPIIRERFAWMKSQGINPPNRGRLFTVLATAMAVVLAFLACYGAYVRLVIAKH